MRRFKYQAKDRKTGRIVNGTVQADSEQIAGKILVDQGYTPSRITEETESFFSRFQNRVSTKERIAFTRQFATLIGAGMPLSASLQMIVDQTENKATKALVEDILAQVESGKSLYLAFKKHPEVFNNVYLSLVEAGEASGTLDVSLRRLADQQEKDADMISKIRGAMTYPAIVLFVIVAVVIFLMLQVVPQVENLYNDLREPLPALTAVMVAISNFIANFWWLVLVILGIAVWFFIQFKRTEAGTKTVDKFKLHAPLVNGLFMRLYNARFARTMQMLLSAGVPMLEAIKISGNAINNTLLEKEVHEAEEMVRSGKPLSVSLKGRENVLPLIPQMAATGEQSGKIDEMLGRAATVYETELDERLAAIQTLIEPVLMVVLAVVAGGIVGAILFPIYSLVSKIGAGGI